MSAFKEGTGRAEWHVAVAPADHSAKFTDQAAAVAECFADLLANLGPKAEPMMTRWLVSDPANQLPVMTWEAGEWPGGVVGQPPLDGSKVALWAVVAEVHESAYEHLFKGGETCWEDSAMDAAAELLDDNVTLGETLTLRTWLFVRDIDRDYREVVEGRNQVFDNLKLTPKTHYIASTGIAGDSGEPTVPVTLDIYNVKGLAKKQVRYLKARAAMSATHKYGVAFERGTAVDYGDRRHVIVSGTASIDRNGNIVHGGDVEGQVRRIWHNIEALLHEAESRLEDVGHFIVYVRDAADYPKVDALMEARFPDVPRILVRAAVCRPGWLVEMECMAVTDALNPDFPAY